MEMEVILSFFSVAILLTLAPGPDILFVIAQSVSQGKQAGIATALGLCTGLLVHISAAVLGVSAVIYQSALAFAIVKYAGAAYLLYLAWQAFREKDSSLAFGRQKPMAYASLYKKGIVMNVLNPKVSLFFLALLPQFVDPSAGQIPQQMLVLGVIFLVQALAVFTLVSIGAEKLRQWLSAHTAITRRIHWLKGAIFALIGIQIAVSERS
ncbi:LysE family translocator [Geobacillus stearothermophilus]|uniref:LysE family translocator n=1 Tax=Geobacillus stearothermophilus TaxID=1422 RepID=UPI0006AC04D6|nr:LysE family translocator [Geobacillus stearothermophilus]KOR95308.1 threonine transporter RhtB [Geobacillus stearothermophilus ATCC 12980]MED3748661.1 LysE family translocator [Geobacillus stearothermophilus]MED3753098.1 LysE family translocator [Geobacillus stearothermophilus]MED4360573.1 LysE family translocator [Geobacillus stearothermophilus]MED4881052.1 LysE family translocator [Geobacillus stearothermophilus]